MILFVNTEFNVHTVWTVNVVLVQPYPFNAVKRVSIDQDIINDPRCMVAKGSADEIILVFMTLKES